VELLQTLSLFSIRGTFPSRAWFGLPSELDQKNMTSDKKFPPATMWLRHAVNDYASARCLLLNGLFGGLVLAQQALEKLLKSYLTIEHPGRTKFIGKKDALALPSLDVNPSHDLVAHWRLAEKSFPHHLALDQSQQDLIANLSYCFHSKYPGVVTPLKSKTTAWLDELDRIFVSWALGVPLSNEERWRSGLYIFVWNDVIPSEDNPLDTCWIRDRNYAFSAAFMHMCEVVKAGSHALRDVHNKPS
jgi:hypothetical protein